MRHFLFSAFFMLSSFCLAQTVQLRWAAELGDARPARFTLVRGDTVELAADLFAEGRPYLPATADAALLWQTNGMGALWWEVPASVASNRVSATWTPAMDCGSSSYLAHFRVGSSTGNVFRAYARLAMQHGPGDPVNAIPLPVPVLDFAKVTVTNAPWGDSTGFSTNEVQAIALTRAEAEAGYTDWVCSPAAITATVVGTPMPGYAPGPGREVSISFRVQRSTDAQYADYWEMHASQYCYEVHTLLDPDGTATNFTAELRLGAAGIGISPSSVVVTATRTRLRPTPGQEAAWDAKVDTSDLTPYARTDSLGTAAFKDSSEFATAADEALIYQLLMGSNVVAEVTNYNSRVRAPQLRLLQLDQDTKEYFTVWAETNGLTRTLNEAKVYADGATNALDRAKADRAWSHSTSGLGADAPAGTTWISTPETVIAGGYEYVKKVTSHGEVWVLCSNGLGLGADTNSYFCVTDGAGETLFSIEKTDSVLVGVDADGISVSGGVVTIPLNVVSQDPPVCYATTSLVNPTWVDLSETTPAWVTASSVTATAGGWQWTIQTSAPSAFFQFRVLQEGSTVIRNNAQTDLSQGILVNGTRFYPHINNGTLTWTTTP